MPRIAYVPKTFNKTHEGIIVQAVSIIETYAEQGYDLTLRQLYYQFVSRNLFPDDWKDPATGSTNNERSYKKLGTIVSDARRAGRIDWNRIVDRTRSMRRPNMWDGPEEIVRACANQFAVDMWEGQDYRPFVLIEKDALMGVLEVACRPWSVPYGSCRGYTSDSEAWQIAQRLDDIVNGGQIPFVLHLGDHDPSGIDMSRDLSERFNMFAQKASGIEVKRIALTMDQVEEVGPPANPAKETDSRFADYRDTFGDECWELDALEPAYITDLIAAEMQALINQELWDARVEMQKEGRRLLTQIADKWDKVTKKL